MPVLTSADLSLERAVEVRKELEDRLEHIEKLEKLGQRVCAEYNFPALELEELLNQFANRIPRSLSDALVTTLPDDELEALESACRHEREERVKHLLMFTPGVKIRTVNRTYSTEGYRWDKDQELFTIGMGIRGTSMEALDPNHVSITDPKKREATKVWANDYVVLSPDEEPTPDSIRVLVPVGSLAKSVEIVSVPGFRRQYW